MKELTHTDARGKASMVDVSAKPPQLRTAIARGMIRLAPTTVKRIRENEIKKGDVLTVAEIAGTMAAKQTPFLIPLCHPLMLNRAAVHCRIVKGGVEVESEVRCTGPTGVEMEALTAVTVALLTIYDMCKAVDKKMEIGEVKLIEKTKEAPEGGTAA